MNDAKQHLLKTLDVKTRYDGRGHSEFRNVSVEYNISKNAEGSARVRIGQTEVLAGVKMSIEKPYPDTPETGNLMVGAELLPLSSSRFESGPPSDLAIEVARVIDRGIRESNTLDLKKYCIEKGEKVWAFALDIVTINDAGNIIDAAGLASIAALSVAKFPSVEDGKVNYKKLSDKKVELKSTPLPITVLKIGNHYIADPTNEEEELADAFLIAASLENGELCALQKGGDSALSSEDISHMVKLAIEKAKELRSKLR